jgi:hypothetical protein
MFDDGTRDIERSTAGLCATCEHARRIESARGSTFILCGLSATDRRFPKYPRLPVVRCDGYVSVGVGKAKRPSRDDERST